MLRAGHFNVYHLYNKVPDVCAFLAQSSPDCHLFGITESRLDSRITDHSISISDYYIIRRDPQFSGQTGIAVYVHKSIQGITHRREDLEDDKIECIWLELKPHVNAPSLFVCYLYRNPAVNFDWYDSFVQMLDEVYKVKHRADVLIFGDSNIDLLKPQSCWDPSLALFGLVQLATSLTRTTPTSSSLIDHIYTNNPSTIIDTSVLDSSISDHA